jgi:hypothetical protein
VTRRQTLPERWFIATGLNARVDLRKLPSDCGVLLLPDVPREVRIAIKHFARKQRLLLLEEKKGAAFRVHNMRELRRTLGRGSPIILISPINATSSHPGWQPMPRMRAATLARLANRNVIALGGMNARRYAKIAPLGFIGWAGISAFRT